MRRLIALLACSALATSSMAQTITGGGSSGGSSTGANPTATIATTAVNGVATTFMRSDAAPAIPSAGITNTSGTAYTLTGSAAQTYTFPTTSASVARTDAAQTFTGVQTLSVVVPASGSVVMNAGSTVFNITNKTLFTTTTPNAPTLTDGSGCSAVSVLSSGSLIARYTINACTTYGSRLTLSAASAATTGLYCEGRDVTTGLDLHQTSISTTAPIMQAYTAAGATTTNFASGDIVLVRCMGY